MEKQYITPEFEVLRVDLLEDALVGDGSTEPSIPVQTDEPVLPTGSSELDDF